MSIPSDRIVLIDTVYEFIVSDQGLPFESVEKLKEALLASPGVHDAYWGHPGFKVQVYSEGRAFDDVLVEIGSCVDNALAAEPVGGNQPELNDFECCNAQTKCEGCPLDD